jgi:hypothetical protein
MASRMPWSMPALLARVLNVCLHAWLGLMPGSTIPRHRAHFASLFAAVSERRLFRVGFRRHAIIPEQRATGTFCGQCSLHELKEALLDQFSRIGTTRAFPVLAVPASGVMRMIFLAGSTSPALSWATSPARAPVRAISQGSHRRLADCSEPAEPIGSNRT